MKPEEPKSVVNQVWTNRYIDAYNHLRIFFVWSDNFLQVTNTVLEQVLKDLKDSKVIENKLDSKISRRSK